jgi:pimeloyl-ACP methyl ester carboxylesterase
MTRFVLVHGAFHGGWCWEEVVPRLERRGHEVWAPDLPGMGADATSGKVATLDEWAEFLARNITASAQRTILVGHSRGGIVISRTAELVADKLAGLVYLTAVLAPPGSSLGETMGLADRSPQELMAPSEDRKTIRMTSRESAKQSFYSATDPAVADRAFDRLCPEPAGIFYEPIRLSAARYGRVPRAYVECLRDAAISIEMQRRMVAAQPCSVRTLDTDHSPFYSRPDELARMLDEIAAGWN